MTVNVELLQDLMSWIDTQKDLPRIDRAWDQGSWVSDNEYTAEELADEYANSMLEKIYGLDYRWWREPQAKQNEWNDMRDALYQIALDQLAPRCGTAYCAAGYIGQKLEPRYREDEVVDGVHVSKFAADALGLTADGGGISMNGAYPVSHPLFNPDNTAEDIRSIIEELVNAGSE